MKFIAFVMITLCTVLSHAEFGVGSQAPDVQMTTLNQGIESSTLINRSLMPNQKVVIEFFSTGCSYCQENMENIRNFTKEFAGRAIFRLVGIDRQEQLTRDFAKENPDFVVGLDAKRIAKKAYEVQATPTTFIIGPDNTILYIGLGAWDEKEKSEIREALSR